MKKSMVNIYLYLGSVIIYHIRYENTCTTWGKTIKSLPFK